jgi:hypothetical protein
MTAVYIPMIEEPHQPSQTTAQMVKPPSVVLDKAVLTEFRQFLENNKENLKHGLGAFHHDDHSNW